MFYIPTQNILQRVNIYPTFYFRKLQLDRVMQLLWIWVNWLHGHEMRKVGAQLGVWRDQCCKRQPNHEMRKGGVQLSIWREQCCKKQCSHEMGKGRAKFNVGEASALTNIPTMKRRKWGAQLVVWRDQWCQ